MKGLKQQINDLGADLARVKLGAAQDKAAAEHRSMTLVSKLGATSRSSSGGTGVGRRERPPSARRAPPRRRTSRSEAISGALGRSVAARDAEIERLEGLGVRSLTKRLLGTAKDKTVAATVPSRQGRGAPYASDKAVSAGRATRAEWRDPRGAGPADAWRPTPSPRAPASSSAVAARPARAPRPRGGRTATRPA